MPTFKVQTRARRCLFLVFKEPIEIGWLAIGSAGAEVDVRDHASGFGNKAEDDVGSFTEVEIVPPCGQWLAPDGDGERFSCRSDGIREQDVPLLGGGGDVQGFVRTGFEEAHKDLGWLAEREMQRLALTSGDADSGKAI